MADSNDYIAAMDIPFPARTNSGIRNPLDQLFGYQLRRASAFVLADLAHALEDLAISPTEASVVLLIERNPGITQSEIGRVLAIKRANMAPIAAHLLARGLIDRTAADGRSQGLGLNETGLAMAMDVQRRIAAHEARFLPTLTAAERADLVALLRSVWLR